LGIRDYFQTIIVSDAVGMKKPDRDIFLYACEYLKASAAQSVYVGDNYENDIMGATRAGLSAIWMIKSTVEISYQHKMGNLSCLKDLL
jgi:putative hydrolase of the HAD superfamily